MTEQDLRWVKIYDTVDAGTSDFCKAAIDFFEAAPHHKLNQEWQRYHQLTNLHTTPLYEELRAIVARVFDHYKKDVGCGTLNYVSRIETPSMSRYDVTDTDGIHHFHSHADCWSMETASRQVSLIIYLNDVTEGGETVFDESTVIKPKAGRVLIFPSSFCFQHRGNPPLSNSKYVIVAWLHFDGTGHAYTTLPL